MESKELVSCIITTYNRPDLVTNAIESVLNQSYKNIELFIIDDHSSLPYEASIEKYIHLANVSYIKNGQNLKPSGSRNIGIELASGKYIAFLDDDDSWLPHKIERQVEILENNPQYLACTSSHIESESQITVDRGIREFTLEHLMVENFLGPPSKMMVRKHLLDNIRFTIEARNGEDWDFYLKILQLGTIFMIKEPLTIYNTGHFERLTNGFSSYSIEQIKEKAHVTYMNKELIGDKNFKLRMARYYFTGFAKRTNKFGFFFKIANEVGLIISLSMFFRILKRWIIR